MNDCLFCKIYNNILEKKIIKENDNFYVIEDINPQAPLHYLIISKEHHKNILELSNESPKVIKDMILLGKDLVQDCDISDSGFRWVINSGKDGGQSVFHFHMHVLGNRRLNWPPG